jgi:hypothetical protein
LWLDGRGNYNLWEFRVMGQLNILLLVRSPMIALVKLTSTCSYLFLSIFCTFVFLFVSCCQWESHTRYCIKNSLLEKKAAAVQLIKKRLSEMPNDPRLWYVWFHLFNILFQVFRSFFLFDLWNYGNQVVSLGFYKLLLSLRKIFLSKTDVTDELMLS